MYTKAVIILLTFLVAIVADFTVASTIAFRSTYVLTGKFQTS